MFRTSKLIFRLAMLFFPVRPLLVHSRNNNPTSPSTPQRELR